MLKFILLEDNDNYLHSINQIVNKVMIRNNTDYKIYKFKEYNELLKKVMKEEGPKIYIIDIELPNISGMDIAREIRETDYYSQIIISSAHYELSDMAFKSKMMILDFVSKYDDHTNKLEKIINYAINILNKGNILKISTKMVDTFVNCSDILYIYKDQNDKKCIIKTLTKDYEINCYLYQIEKQLDSNFIKTHRSFLVNKYQIEEISYKNMAIKFKNGIIVDNIISRKYRKENKIA